MQSLWQDVRFSVRTLLKKPGFALIAIFTLALGIGANSAIFSVINSVLLRPLPYKEPERLALVQQSMPKLGFYYGGVSAPELLDYIAENKTFTEMAGYGTISLNLTGDTHPLRLQAARVSANLFSMLGVSPLLGRSFSTEEAAANASSVVILSEKLWQTQFAGDPKIIGRTIRLDERPYTVVGVMPSQLHFPPTGTAFADAVELWTPLALTEDEKQARRRDSNFNLIGRLKPGVPIEQAQADVESIAAHIEQQHPDIYQGTIRITANAVGLADRMAQGVRRLLWVLLGAVGLVLLIACANVANLLLARAASRRKEIAIRSALGAGRARIVRQLLTESLLLALVAGVVGALLAWWVTDLIARFGPEDVPRLAETRLDGRVLAFTLLVSTLTGVLFGLVPAWQSARINLTTALKESARNSSGEGTRLRAVLVALEMALAVVLLIGAGLLINGFVRLMHVSPGFNPEGVVVARTTLPATRYPDIERGKAVYRQALNRIAALPGVQSVSVASNLPLTDEWQIGFRVEGGDENAFYTAHGSFISNDYFRAMGIPLMKGRGFTDDDRPDGVPVIVVNETMARRFWPGQEAIGKRIRWGGWNPQGWLTIVGVATDVKLSSLEAESEPTVYMPTFQISRLRREALFIARTSADPSDLATALRREINAVDADLPVYDIRTMNEVVADSVAQRRFTMWLLTGFAAAALLLAAIGLYGVISYSVAQRTQEIGIRMALGAQTGNVVRQIVAQGMKLALVGLWSGLIAAFALTRLMTNLLYGVSATDPLTFAGIAILLSGVALLACWVPARRAAKVDPMIALRYE
ncbi:MAG: ABC transporter permease [Acidobacteria bacterium]|nr:ABC transporter permease [Acidobacteriota bacterium]